MAKKKATEARERAEAATAVIEEVAGEEGLGTELERSQRNAQIFRAAMRGVHPITLSFTYGLSERQIRRILAEQRNRAKQAAEVKADPLEAVDEYLWLIDGVIDELASVSAREQGAARVSAILGRLTALKERRDVLQSVGILPHDLGALKQIADITLLGKKLIEIFERHKIDGGVWDDVQSMLDENAGTAVIESTAVEVEVGDSESG